MARLFLGFTLGSLTQAKHSLMVQGLGLGMQGLPDMFSELPVHDNVSAQSCISSASMLFSPALTPNVGEATSHLGPALP